jgi:hypothetical protein
MEKPMRLELDETELNDLREAVGVYLKSLLGELAHADQRNFRTMLREKCDRFERLAGRIDRGNQRSRDADRATGG